MRERLNEARQKFREEPSLEDSGPLGYIKVCVWTYVFLVKQLHDAVVGFTYRAISEALNGASAAKVGALTAGAVIANFLLDGVMYGTRRALGAALDRLYDALVERVEERLAENIVFVVWVVAAIALLYIGRWVYENWVPEFGIYGSDVSQPPQDDTAAASSTESDDKQNDVTLSRGFQ